LPTGKASIPARPEAEEARGMIDFDAIASAETRREPFAFFAAPGVLSAVDLAAVRADFPAIREPGIFPLSEISHGPAFARLIDDIRSREPDHGGRLR
jgi:hypothetical protein